MSGKIRIKVGELEVECEGSEEFLKKELPELLKTITNLHPLVPTLGGGVNNKGDIKLTTTSIAAKLGCDSGTDLVIAACAHLAFVTKTETFNRKTILNEMKKATSYYKASYSSNLSSYLQTLVQHEKLTESSTNTYSLHANTIKELHAKLAQ